MKYSAKSVASDGLKINGRYLIRVTSNDKQFKSDNVRYENCLTYVTLKMIDL